MVTAGAITCPFSRELLSSAIFTEMRHWASSPHIWRTNLGEITSGGWSLLGHPQHPESKGFASSFGTASRAHCKLCWDLRLWLRSMLLKIFNCILYCQLSWFFVLIKAWFGISAHILRRKQMLTIGTPSEHGNIIGPSFRPLLRSVKSDETTRCIHCM